MRLRAAAVGVLAALALAALPALAGPKIQEYLESLRIGDTLDQVRLIYPPTREWTKYREPGGRVIRMIVERGSSRWFPSGVSTLKLGMRWGRLVHIQAIYDKEESRRKPLEEVVLDLSLMYGEPRRVAETYFWHDGSIVLAASYAEISSERGGAKELRTSLELMDQDYFQPKTINVIE